MVRINESRGQVSHRVGLVTGFTRLNINILQAHETLIRSGNSNSLQLKTPRLLLVLTSVCALCWCLYFNKKWANLGTSSSSIPRAWKRNQHVRLFGICSARSNNTLRHYTQHGLTQRREPSFTTVCSSFSRGASRFRSLSSTRKPWDRRRGNFWLKVLVTSFHSINVLYNFTP